jgi:hypothetical protein
MIVVQTPVSDQGSVYANTHGILLPFSGTPQNESVYANSPRGSTNVVVLPQLSVRKFIFLFF